MTAAWLLLPDEEIRRQTNKKRHLGLLGVFFVVMGTGDVA